MNTICLSENANRILKNYLENKGYALIEIRKTSAVYDAIASHGDIYLCKLPNEVVVASEQQPLIEAELLCRKIKYTEGAGSLDHHYPSDVKFNAVQMGRYLIHNTHHTDAVILDKAKEHGLELIHVRQGYTKCSLAVIDDNSVITSDAGLAASLEKYHFEILLVSQGHVRLPGFPSGFLGGASGRTGNEIIFNGDLSAHPDFKIIREFIRERGLELTFFKEYPLEDIGSILQL